MTKKQITKLGKLGFETAQVLEPSSVKRFVDAADRQRKQVEAFQSALKLNELQDVMRPLQSISESLSRFSKMRGLIGSDFPRVSPFHSVKQLLPDTEASVLSEPSNIVKNAGDLGELVRARRKSRKQTQQKFADMAGVGRRFVSELENGKGTLEINKVLKVLAAAGIDLLAQER